MNTIISVIRAYGYVGVFLATFFSCASIFFPVPSHLIVAVAAPFMDPFLIGISAGLGAALGEITGYFIGAGSKELLERKYSNALEVWRKWFGKFGFFAIVFFALTPLPDDVVGILAGAARYDIKKFLLANFIGKTIMYTILALASRGLVSLVF